MHRRNLLKTIAVGSTTALINGQSLAGNSPLPSNDMALGMFNRQADEPDKGERPSQDPSVKVLNPKNKVPLSFIIDDSTCLVNLAHFCIPQFAEVFPDRYKQDWRKLPREIPDDFVRKFADWCGERKVKGKYSIVPYPACVGWVDREMPGWTKKELEASIQLVKDRLAPDWDIHPEMISHTWAINTKTGRPYEERNQIFMENWGFSVGKSPDEMTDYLAYALRILKNAGFVCEGVTTPGGFGNRARRSLSLGTLQACKEVYNTEIPHYFRHLYVDDRSVAPRVENAKGISGVNAECVVSIIGCTGDWFGGWDGLTPGDVNKFISPDLASGRMVEVIESGEPAIMVCHWPGIYYNGKELGFNIFKKAVDRIHKRFGENVIWMNLSEISRYWTAKELTAIKIKRNEIHFFAPFASPEFTIEIQGSNPLSLLTENQKEKTVFRKVKESDLSDGTYYRNGKSSQICFDLPKGKSVLFLSR